MVFNSVTEAQHVRIQRLTLDWLHSSINHSPQLGQGAAKSLQLLPGDDTPGASFGDDAMGGGVA